MLWLTGSQEVEFKGKKLSEDLHDCGAAKLALDGQGGYHGVWWCEGEPYRIDYRYSPDSGVTWQPAERLSADPNDLAKNPVIAVDAKGVVHVAWSEVGKLFYRRRTQAGTWEPPINLTKGQTGSRPALAVDRNGLASIAWGFRCPFYLVQQAPDGSWSAPRQITADYDCGIGSGIKLAVDNAGTRHLVWEEPGNDGQLDIFYGQVPR